MAVTEQRHKNRRYVVIAVVVAIVALGLTIPLFFSGGTSTSKPETTTSTDYVRMSAYVVQSGSKTSCYITPLSYGSEALCWFYTGYGAKGTVEVNVTRPSYIRLGAFTSSPYVNFTSVPQCTVPYYLTWPLNTYCDVSPSGTTFSFNYSISSNAFNPQKVTLIIVVWPSIVPLP